MQNVDYAVRDNIAIIAIDNPPINAINQGVRQGIKQSVEQASNDDSIDGIVIYAVGRTFIAGADIKEFGKPPLEPFLPDVCRTIEQSPKPVVAVLHGTPLGGGLEIALSAHYRIATPTTSMGFPEVTLGIIPGSGGTQRLPRVVGVENAVNMITSGKRVGTKSALDMGLIDKMVEGGNIAQLGIDYLKDIIGDGKTVTAISQRDPINPLSDEQLQTLKNNVIKKARGKIAPLKAFETIVLCQWQDFDTAITAERKTFLALQQDPQSLALRHIFAADRKANKIPNMPKDIQSKDIQTVGVIGLGTMGASIAMCFAGAGMAVTVIEIDDEKLTAGMGRIQSQYDASLKRGVYTQDKVDKALSLITPSTDLHSLSHADLVLEAIFENMDIKTTVLKNIDGVVGADTIIATNTSYLDVNTLASQVSHPERVIGLHFFSPAHIMKLLEIVRTDRVSDTVLATAVSLSKKLKKIGVVSGVCHGFIGNRMMQSYFRQAEYLIEDGASPYAVDTAMTGFGFNMGIFAIGDLSGLDISYAFRRSQDATRPTDMRYPALADAVHDAGRLGRKTGYGWYDYSTSKNGDEDPFILDMLAQHRAQKNITAQSFSNDDIVWHILCALVNEGAHILSENIAYRPSDIDVTWVRGYGFPDYVGGPMFWADSVGLDKILAHVEHCYKTDIYNWKPAPLLQELVAQGQKFADYN